MDTDELIYGKKAPPVEEPTTPKAAKPIMPPKNQRVNPNLMKEEEAAIVAANPAKWQKLAEDARAVGDAEGAAYAEAVLKRGQEFTSARQNEKMQTETPVHKPQPAAPQQKEQAAAPEEPAEPPQTQPADKMPIKDFRVGDVITRGDGEVGAVTLVKTKNLMEGESPRIRVKFGKLESNYTSPGKDWQIDTRAPEKNPPGGPPVRPAEKPLNAEQKRQATAAKEAALGEFDKAIGKNDTAGWQKKAMAEGERAAAEDYAPEASNEKHRKPFMQGWRGYVEDTLAGKAPVIPKNHDAEMGWRAANEWASDNPLASANKEPVSVTTQTARGQKTKYQLAPDKIAETKAGVAKLPVQRFYSNPLDPHLLKRLFEPLPPKEAPAAEKQARAAVGGVNKYFQGIEKSSREARDALRMVGGSTAGALQALESRHPHLKAFKEAIDATGSDRPGSGVPVKEGYVRTAARKTREYGNRMGNILGDKIHDKKFMAELRDALTGKKTSVPEPIVRRMRAWLDDLNKYAKDTGLDIGYVKNYFPRVFEEEAIMADPQRFKLQLEKAIRATGVDQTAAAARAEEVYREIAMPNDLFSGPGRTGKGMRVTDPRSLGPEADTVLKDFLVTDPKEILYSYTESMARQAEWARHFGRYEKPGVNGQKVFNENGKIADWVRELADDSALTPGERDAFSSALQSATGRMVNANAGNALTRYSNTAFTLATMKLLPHNLFSALHEGAVTGTQTHNAMHGLRAFSESLADFMGTAGKDGEKWGKLADFIGAVASHELDTLALHRTGADASTKANRQLMHKYFTLTGTNRITRAGKVRAVKMGQLFFKDIAEEIAAHPDAANEAKFNLADFGIAKEDTVEFAKWIMSQNDGMPGVNHLEATSGKWLEAYKSALVRLAERSITTPYGLDKPWLASTPARRMAYGLMSFNFGYTRNVLHPAIRRFKAAATGKAGEHDFTAGERLHLAASTAVPLLIVGAIAGAISEGRDYLFNKTRRQGQSTATRAVTDLDRAGFFGSASPIVNTLAYAYLQKYATGNSSSLEVGAQRGLMYQEIDALKNYFTANSAKTANAEKNALGAVYDLAVGIAINRGLTAAVDTGNPLAMIAGFLALQAVNSSEVKRWTTTHAAEKLTGQKVRQRAAPGTVKKDEKGLRRWQ